MVVNIKIAHKSPTWLKYKDLVDKVIIEKKYIDGTGVIVDSLPYPNEVRDILEQYFNVYSDRNFRVILVEDYKDYKVFIQIPDGKSNYDFYVWRAIFENEKPIDIKVPTHDDLAIFFIDLKSKHEDLREYLINAIIKLIHQDYRWGVPKIISKYFNNLDDKLKNEVGKFLSTLKWIALQEDINYPPTEKKLGSKYTLALYALLEAGFTMNDIRRIIRF